tara:strand:+ start:817 stop:957 length:141 start_codon:yes stop_codon:yes gene_type:complete
MFKQWMKRLQEKQQRRADYWLLQNMTDKELNDIGVSRGEINQRFYR